jgi:carboxypeptidase C (cathepsin A)
MTLIEIGPGSSSMYGILEENGPCYANPDSNSTRLSEWSWNNEGTSLLSKILAEY